MENKILKIFADVDGLSCYQCTSLNNTKCGDPFKAKDTLKECPENEEHLVHLNVTAALSCRKLKQTSKSTTLNFH